MNTAYGVLLDAQLATTGQHTRSNREAAEQAIRALIRAGYTLIRDDETWVEFGHCDNGQVVKHGRQPSPHAGPLLVRICVAGPWRPAND